MHHFLQKLHKAAAAAEKPTQLLTESIEALEALEVSAKGDNFEVHSENMMTAMSVLPAGFLLDYFPASLDVCGDDDDQYSILVAEFKSGNVMRWDVNAVNGFDRMIGGFVLCGLMASSHGVTVPWKRSEDDAAIRAAKSVLRRTMWLVNQARHLRGHVHALLDLDDASDQYPEDPEDFDKLTRGFEKGMETNNLAILAHFGMLIRQRGTMCFENLPEELQEHCTYGPSWCPKHSLKIVWSVPDKAGKDGHAAWIATRKELEKKKYTCAWCSMVTPEPRYCPCSEFPAYCSSECRDAHWTTHKAVHKAEAKKKKKYTSCCSMP